MEELNTSILAWGEKPPSQYENWYGIVHHQREPIAFWYRYTLTAFEKGSVPEARLWSVLFDKTRPSDNFVRTTWFDLKEVTVSQNPFCLALGRLGSLTTQKAEGKHSGDGSPLSWELSFEPASLTYASVPLRSMAQAPSGNLSNNNLKVFGHLSLGDRTIEFSDARSHRGHTWGRRMPLRWIWGHCNAFDNDSDAVFEGVSFETQRSEGARSPVTSFYLRYLARNYFFSTPAHLIRTNQSTHQSDFWRFSGTCGDIRIEGELTPDADQTHHVRYLDVDETELFNRNSCLGRGAIKVFRERAGAWRLEKELRATETVAFEYVDRSQDDHVYRPSFA